MTFELLEDEAQDAVIKVFGVGGGGGNAVSHMIAAQVDGVDFICANTDAQVLRNQSNRTCLQLGRTATKGLGAGADPEVGRQAAVEDRDRIAAVLEGADMVFITAGLGGGSGTCAAPVIADIAKSMGILTVAVVTKPFPFEQRKRMRVAEAGIQELEENVDSLIVIPNDKLLKVLGPDSMLEQAFDAADEVLRGAVQGIADLIMRPGSINADFADVKTVMREMGKAMMGTAIGTGEYRAREAAEAAVRSPLLEDVDLKGARGILVNITSGPNLTLGEFNEVGDTINEFADENALNIVGWVVDESMGEDVKVTVVATGLGQERIEAPRKVVDNTTRADGTLDYAKLERPAIMRRDARDSFDREALAKAVGSDDVDYLDIPAFLRRQAD